MTQVDEQLVGIAWRDPESDETEGIDDDEVLVEEISIDGMCGVY
jgi:mycofactocin precursor